MTPGARVQAAIEILDRIEAGEAAEKALTGWARGARYAGSKDRAAIRDHVFDVLRMWRSAGAAGGGATARARMIGRLHLGGQDPSALFTGEGHAPAPLTKNEVAAHPVSPAEARDLPDWLWSEFKASLGPRATEVAEALRHRAPVGLRVNLRKADRATAAAALAEDGIATRPNPRAETALIVTENPRRVTQSRAFLDGLVELQDAASQAAIADLPLAGRARILDFCAGGGGKSLAMAARCDGIVTAYDTAPARMRDIPARAERAGVEIRVTTAPEGSFDLILCDVPCSGSGTWRRAPEAKWRLTPERLVELQQMQAGILDAAAALLVPGGTLAYATCSVLRQENVDQVAAFLDRHRGFAAMRTAQAHPDGDGDGFFHAILSRE